MVFDELDTRKWNTEGTKESEVRHIFEDHDQNENLNCELIDKGIETNEPIPVEYHIHEKPQRRKHVRRRI